MQILPLPPQPAARARRSPSPHSSPTRFFVVPRREPPREAEQRLAACTAELAQTREALQRSRRTCRRLEHASKTAVVDERNRIAREIHDTVAQALTAIIIQLRNADAALTAGSPGTAQKDVERAVEFARAGLGEMRRCVRAWRAQTPGGSDFATAVAQLVERVTSGTDLRTGLAVKGTPKKVHGPSAESMLRIVQEGLTNALRHARATRFDATIAYEPRALRVTLRDDGCGFDPARTHEGFGLLGIKERVAASRGQLTITSAIGRGTTTEIVLPYR